MTVYSFVVNCSIGGSSGVVLARILLLWNFPEIVYWVRFRVKRVCFDRFWCSYGANGVSCSFPMKEVCFWPMCSNSVDTTSLNRIILRLPFLWCQMPCISVLKWSFPFILYFVYVCFRLFLWCFSCATSSRPHPLFYPILSMHDFLSSFNVMYSECHIEIADDASVWSSLISRSFKTHHYNRRKWACFVFRLIIFISCSFILSFLLSSFLHGILSCKQEWRIIC